MNKMAVPVLFLIDVIITLTSAEDSVQVVSFRKSRRTQNGPGMCALDAENKTISSSSVEQC